MGIYGGVAVVPLMMTHSGRLEVPRERQRRDPPPSRYTDEDIDRFIDRWTMSEPPMHNIDGRRTATANQTGRQTDGNGLIEGERSIGRYLTIHLGQITMKHEAS